jgi:hypothetical protein
MPSTVAQETGHAWGSSAAQAALFAYHKNLDSVLQSTYSGSNESDAADEAAEGLSQMRASRVRPQCHVDPGLLRLPTLPQRNRANADDPHAEFRHADCN